MSKAIECDYSVEGEGPTVFLIHGIGASRHTWDGVIARLKPEFRCISYDLRGHGESATPPLPYDLDDPVADLERLRERVGVERAHIAGQSLGGMIGPAYARAYPARVQSLGVLSTAAGRTPEDSAKVMAVVEAMEEQGIEALLDALVERWFTPAFCASRPEVVAARRAQVLRNDPAVFLNVFRIYAQTDTGPWLPEIQVPSLVLTGENDGGCNPRLNSYIAGRLPNAELVILDGLRHAILLEAPDLVAEHLRRFLQANSGSP